MDLKNAYIQHLTLQKVGHKIREEKSIYATETTVVDERKEEDLIPFLLSPFRKNLEVKQFSHYTEKLEFNKVYQLTKNYINEDDDFVKFSNDILTELFNASLHPQIKSGEVFMVELNNVLYDDIPCKAIGIYKLENKSKFIRFDERNSIDYDVLKGYKLDKIDKAALILDVHQEEGYRVFTIDNQKAESEFWTKNFLEVTPVVNPRFQTKKYIQAIEDFSHIVLEKTNKKDQANFINNSIETLINYDFMNPDINSEIFAEHKEEFNQYLQENEIPINFEIDTSELLSQAKKIKSIIKLDTGITVNIDLLNTDSKDEIERGYDEERKMFYYKVYFNTEN